MYDLIIIGGGPTGLNCAISAAKAQLNYLVLEKGVLVNSIYHFPTNMTFFSTSLRLEIGGVPFISHADKPTRREALEYYRRVQQAYGLNIKLYEPVLRMEPTTAGHYDIKTTKGHYQTHSVVVATGFYDTPRMLEVPGEDLPKVKHYYDDAHPYVGQKVLVVGAANSACDVALETFYKGAQVSMAIRSHEIYPKVKYWIRPNIENRIKEGSIQAYFNTEVVAIYPDRVYLRGPDGPFTIENDFVLAMTGYQPNYDLLQRLGLHCSEDEAMLPEHDAESLETHLPNVYVAGVVCGGRHTSKWFIENTRDHGERIVQQIRARLAC
ncbi:MAG: YpdA family putative bacillithiol disulfide reductase [Bacteroidetes bacterium]|nr:MAG: YpdA family putative bacillithiol disulfide reductase [Bacteroidota bacterium]